MSSDKKRYFLYIDGQAVPVTKQVYDAYWHYTEKEEYFMRRLKKERFICDQETQTVTFIPSREDSYERFLELEVEFPAEESSVEDQVLSSIWLREILQTLIPEEQEIIRQLYFLNKTEREACAAMNLPKTSFRRKKEALLKKLRRLIKERS